MQTAMVWGAAGGIGRAITTALVENRFTVVAVTRQSAGLDAVTPHVIEADVSDPFSVQQAVLLAAQRVSAVDLWIYAAGDIASATVEDMELATWERILSANLTGAYLAVHHSLPLLAEDAHLVFLGAVSERLRLPGLSAYASAKAGLEAFAEALRKEQRKRRVTVVRPGAVHTSLWEKVSLNLPGHAASPQDVARRILEAHASGHKGVLDIV